METETLEIKIAEISLQIRNNLINSLRRNDICRKAARVFKDGSLGLAAAQGEISFSQLLRKAEDGLTLGLQWNYPLPENLVYKKDVTQGLKPLSEEGILNFGESLLKELTSRNPDFIFSNQMRDMRKTVILKNSKGVSLSRTTQEREVSLIFKHRESSNIIDGFLGTRSLRLLDTKEYLQRYTQILQGYRSLKRIHSGRKKVVFLNEEILFRKFYESLRGDKYHQGASLLSGKLGRKIFSEGFTLHDSNSLLEKGYFSPFDMEGVKRDESDLVLIENGILRNAIFDLRNAAKYGKRSTGNGYRAYSQNPDIHFNALNVKRGEKTVEEILGGEEALFILVASGGDFLDNGDFSTPVQLSFIYKDGKIVARAPQLTVKSNFFQIFGEDLVAVSRDSFMSNRVNPYLIMEMDTQIH